MTETEQREQFMEEIGEIMRNESRQSLYAQMSILSFYTGYIMEHILPNISGYELEIVTEENEARLNRLGKLTNLLSMLPVKNSGSVKFMLHIPKKGEAKH